MVANSLSRSEILMDAKVNSTTKAKQAANTNTTYTTILISVNAFEKVPFKSSVLTEERIQSSSASLSENQSGRYNCPKDLPEFH